MLPDGVLFVNKSQGCTSKDVSRLLSKKFGKKLKLGHIGTLDPLASGVLPVAIGKATRLQNYLLEGQKKYEFEFELGFQTDTLDLQGQTELEKAWDHICEEDVKKAVVEFPRHYEQVPPLYSAVKVNGKSLHRWARQGRSDGIDLNELKRPVEIYELNLLSIALPKITLAATVSKGTYVRCLARDLANILGTCATVTRLVRTESLGIDISDTTSLENIAEATEESLSQHIVPLTNLNHPQLEYLPISSSEMEKKLKNGLSVLVTETSAFEPKNLVNKTVLLLSNGNVFGIAKVDQTTDNNYSLRMIRGLS